MLINTAQGHGSAALSQGEEDGNLAMHLLHQDSSQYCPKKDYYYGDSTWRASNLYSNASFIGSIKLGISDQDKKHILSKLIL